MDAGRVVLDGPPPRSSATSRSSRRSVSTYPLPRASPTGCEIAASRWEKISSTRPTARRSLCRRRSFTLKLMQPDVATPILSYGLCLHIPGRYSEGRARR